MPTAKQSLSNRLDKTHVECEFGSDIFSDDSRELFRNIVRIVYSYSNVTLIKFFKKSTISFKKKKKHGFFNIFSAN